PARSRHGSCRRPTTGRRWTGCCPPCPLPRPRRHGPRAAGDPGRNSAASVRVESVGAAGHNGPEVARPDRPCGPVILPDAETGPTRGVSCMTEHMGGTGQPAPGEDATAASEQDHRLRPTVVHLMRHGEVHNPGGVLYGRLPEFHLSDIGIKMAERGAEWFADRDLGHLRCSPLERAQPPMAPIAERL